MARRRNIGKPVPKLRFVRVSSLHSSGEKAKTIVKYPDGREQDLNPGVSNPARVFTYKVEDDPFIRACLNAKRTGKVGLVTRLLRSDHQLGLWDKQAMANLLEQAKLKRPRGNARRKDPWVAEAVELARDQKQRLHRGGWKKGKGRSIDDEAIDNAITLMMLNEAPEPPYSVEKLIERVHTELHRSRQPRKKNSPAH